MPTRADEARLTEELAEVRRQREAQMAAFALEKATIQRIAHERGSRNGISRSLDRMLIRHGLEGRPETTSYTVLVEVRQRLSTEQWRATRNLPGMADMAAQNRPARPLPYRLTPAYDVDVANYGQFLMLQQHWSLAPRPIQKECVCGQPFTFSDEERVRIWGSQASYDSYYEGLEVSAITVYRCGNLDCKHYVASDDEDEDDD